MLSVELRAEGVFVEPHDRRLSGTVIDGKNIEAAKTLGDVAFREEPLSCAHHDALLFFCHAQFWQRRRIFFHSARSNFHKRQSGGRNR